MQEGRFHIMQREWLDPYMLDVKAVFESVEERLRQYPDSLADHALEQLRLLNPVRRDSEHSSIGYITPLWMQYTDGLSPDQAHQLSTACLLHMMYFLNLDDVMDEPTEDAVLKLSLGNLCYMDALQVYSALFEPSSAFWNYFRQLLQDWAVSVNGELHMDYFQQNPLLIAQKASPSLLGAIGSLLLLGQTDRITSICAGLNIVLMTLQMTDDFTDTKQDAEHGNYNSYLSHISAALQQEYPTFPLNESTSHNIFNSQFMNSYADIAHHFNDTLTSSNDDLPQLVSLNSYLCKLLVQAIQEIEQRKKGLYQGGFHYWISESQSETANKGTS
jgi:hypothetical protein